jgi:hypothetical protein
MTCERCGHELQVGDYPFCKGSPAGHVGGIFGVIGDDIPGGVLIKHAICNADGSPKRYYSRSEITRTAKAAGYSNHVEHIGSKGSDKSPHTTRWV